MFWMYSVWKKNSTRELINSRVFNSGQERLAITKAPFLETFLRAAKIRPHSHPSRIRGTNKVNKRPNGLICNKAALKAEPPVRAIMALVRPKAPPQMAPAVGPRIMAPTATGTVKKVMVSHGVRR